MTQVQILPPAAKFLKKLKDKKLKSLYKEAIEMICEDYSIGEEKTGDLAGMYGYDIYYNKTNLDYSRHSRERSRCNYVHFLSFVYPIRIRLKKVLVL